MKKRRIILLDTHAILHRAYHALPDFVSPKGEPTGALFGLTSFLIKIMDELEPDYIIAAYDLPDRTHRHESFAEYKATRVKADEELVAQLESSRSILTALSVPYLECPGYEADDILGTLSEKLKQMKDVEVIIASGDMDTLQLVDDDRVRVFTLKKGISDTVLYDEKAVRARYTFGPELIADYKGLRGDPSDNIPGIRGIGEKTATTLICTFGGIDEIYTVLHKDSKQFAEAGIKPRIVTLLEEGEDDARFSKELATIRRDTPVDIPTLETPWLKSIHMDEAFELFSSLGFRTLSQRLKLKMGGTEEQRLEIEEVVDEKELRQTAVALWLVRSDITNPTKEDMLEYTGKHSFADAKKVIFNELATKGAYSVYEKIELPLMPVVDALEKRGILLDTQYLKKLSKRYHTDLEKLAQQIYAKADTEFNINSPKQLGEVLFDKLAIGSGKGKRTATGQRSTREDELRKYEHDEPIVSDILEYRELQKLLSTYIDNLPTMVDSTSRLHAHFSQTGTSTGRMSSQAPNMQNMPIKSSRGAAIRKAVIAPKGWSLVSADYNQIELRVAAIISKDEKLIASFKEGKDIHTSVASQVFEVEPQNVTKDMRRKAKVINFGILYGMGANALAAALHTDRKDAKRYLDDYFKKFQGISGYIENIETQIAKQGFTETLFGRRRYFEGAHSPLPHMRAQALRMALNAPIQGTSADIIKIAMVRIAKMLQEQQLQEKAYLVAQIHDELLYEVRDEELTVVTDLVRDTMQTVMEPEETQSVPLTVDVATGKNWGEMDKVF